MSKVKQAAMIVVGFGLIIIPEPATSIFGAILVLGAFGMEDKAP